MLGILPDEQTERMFTRHLDQLADVAASWSRAEAARRSQLQDQADADMAAVLFDRTLRPDQRWDLFARRKGLVGWSDSQRAAIEALLRGDAPVRDDPDDLAQLADQVRSGRIRTIPDLIEDIGANRRAVSPDTIESRFKALLEARQDRRFSDALDRGYRTLGVAPGALALLAPDAADTATQFESRLLDAYRQSPDGDLMQAADDIVQRLQDAAAQDARDALPEQQKASAIALQSNDPEAIAGVSRALGATQHEAGTDSNSDSSGTSETSRRAVNSNASQEPSPEENYPSDALNDDIEPGRNTGVIQDRREASLRPSQEDEESQSSDTQAAQAVPGSAGQSTSNQPNAGVTSRSKRATEQNIKDLARILQTEMRGESKAEQIAVGRTVLNRMARNKTDSVRGRGVWSGYKHGKNPDKEMLELARRLLNGEVADTTGGATHFYTPRLRTDPPDFARQYEEKFAPGVSTENMRLFRPPGTGRVR